MGILENLTEIENIISEYWVFFLYRNKRLSKCRRNSVIGNIALFKTRFCPSRTILNIKSCRILWDLLLIQHPINRILINPLLEKSFPLNLDKIIADKNQYNLKIKLLKIYLDNINKFRRDKWLLKTVLQDKKSAFNTHKDHNYQAGKRKSKSRKPPIQHKYKSKRNK